MPAIHWPSGAFHQISSSSARQSPADSKHTLTKETHRRSQEAKRLDPEGSSWPTQSKPFLRILFCTSKENGAKDNLQHCSGRSSMLLCSLEQIWLCQSALAQTTHWPGLRSSTPCFRDKTAPDLAPFTICCPSTVFQCTLYPHLCKLQSVVQGLWSKENRLARDMHNLGSLLLEKYY